MNSFYEFLDSAVSIENILFSLMLSLIASLIIGLLFSALSKSVKGGMISFAIFELICVLLFFAIRDKVQTYRLNEIVSVMSSIRNNYQSNGNKNTSISNWKEGLELISKNPQEIGLYIKTVKYLENDYDYESAATLIELGLDFMNYEEIPTILCEKLQLYYRKLPNKPELYDDCIKIHQL